MQDLEDYRNHVKRLAAKRSTKIIYNADKAHAVVLLSELIRNTKENLRIICKNMDPEVTGEPAYIEAMKEFLDNRSCKIKILMTDYYKDKSIFDNSEILKLFKDYKNQVKVRFIDKSIVDLVHIKGKLVNFTTSDDLAFRFETDVEKNMAIGCFNDRDTVGLLNKSFSALFYKCPNEYELSL